MAMGRESPGQIERPPDQDRWSLEENNLDEYMTEPGSCYFLVASWCRPSLPLPAVLLAIREISLSPSLVSCAWYSAFLWFGCPPVGFPERA